MKRLFDLTCSLIGLVFVSPFLLLMAAVIKADSAGPVFYRGVRVGRLGRLFRIFKLRTMVVNADKMGGSSTADDDPRLTRAGKFLRRYKLDELPQLLNVLEGEMSLVGPRPEVPIYVALLTEVEKKIVLSVRPGITDWASLWNSDEGALLAGSPDAEKTFLEKVRREKVRWQVEYVRRRSFLIDVRIIFQTLAVVVFRTGPPALEALSEKGSGG